MKKIFFKEIFYIFIFSITLFAFVNNVKADNDTSYVNLYIQFMPTPNDNPSFTQEKNYLNQYSDTITDFFETLHSIWQSDYSSDFPYYYVALRKTISNQVFSLGFYGLSSPLTIDYDSSQTYTSANIYASCVLLTDNTTSCDSDFSTTPVNYVIYNKSLNNGIFRYHNYFFSNFDLKFTNINTTYIGYDLTGSTSLVRSFLRESASAIPTAYETFELTFLNNYTTQDYVEVNLNDWAYVVLSLKDYDNLISPVIFDVKGQLCLTPVYDYGQTEKNVTDRCSLPYDDFTPVRVWISQTDLDNKAVFYLIAYDTSIDNIVKVDRSVFNISYITPEQASEPTAIINGQSYPVLPYDSLSSSATINEENGFIPGQTENIFDVSSNSNFIDNLFSNPLESLSTVWTSITTMFALIGSFLGLLPTTLQAFLYTTLAIGLSIGLIKILIG